MPHKRRRPHTSLPRKRHIKPDSVLLHRELRWIGTTVLACAAIGQILWQTQGAALGACAGFLLQQTAYRLTVHILWIGWYKRSIRWDGPARAADTTFIALRAFTLWMRTANTADRLYVLLWGISHGPPEDIERAEVDASPVEIRVRDAYTRVCRLDNEPLRCDDEQRRRLRHSLQRDEVRLLRLATGKRIED